MEAAKYNTGADRGDDNIWKQILGDKTEGENTNQQSVHKEVIMNEFVEVFGVRDLLGVGAFGVVL
jgi:hypothetical protein